MNERVQPETLDTLVCELGRRPKGAPTIAEVAPSVRALRRQGNTLIVDFDPAATDVVAAVVDAERQCCSTIGWHLETDQRVQLRIDATPMQLDVLEAMFSAVPTV